MLVYRKQSEQLETAAEVARLRAAPCATHDDAVELLIRAGQLESAVADSLFPHADADHPTAAALRRVTLAAGRVFRASLNGGGRAATGTDEVGLQAALDEVARADLPRVAEAGPPEGYAWYSLYPEMYFEAARRFYAEARPDRAVVIGIRNIGASLSAAVAAALEAEGCAVDSITVRPHGHPFERTTMLAPELAARLSRFDGARFAVVDEGPGLSGSSLTSVAAALSALGISDGRIALFPSWVPDGTAFRSEAARLRWRRHAKYAVPFEDVYSTAGLEDLSGGRWRERFCGPAVWPAVQPQHERRKYLGPDFIERFAGLGRFGRARFERAVRLGAAGFSPRPLELARGFLKLEFVRGCPLGGREDVTAGLLDTMARYLEYLAGPPAARSGASFDELCQMIEVNAGGSVPAGFVERFRAPVSDAVPVEIDGRMLPHEWLLTEAGYVKTDSLDHHDDHFFPGCQDIAWDLAAARAEFDLDDRKTAYLTARLGGAALASRLPFYSVAYLAFRLGYATLARDAIAGTPDAARFDALTQRYRAALATAIRPCR
jgi:hypothetical protein